MDNEQILATEFMKKYTVYTEKLFSFNGKNWRRCCANCYSSELDKLPKYKAELLKTKFNFVCKKCRNPVDIVASLK